MVKIQRDKIDVTLLKDVLKKNDAGAIILFLGEPRRSKEDGDVVSINYTAYEEMAIREMKKIEREAKNKFHVKDVIIVHRIGNIPLKEISFFVGVSSAHRKEGFKACQWIVDEVKSTVPIWKEIKYEVSRNS